MDFEVIWSGRGSLPDPRSERDQLLYQTVSLVTETRRFRAGMASAQPNKGKVLVPGGTCACGQAISAAEYRQGMRRCRPCRAANPGRTFVRSVDWRKCACGRLFSVPKVSNRRRCEPCREGKVWLRTAPKRAA